MPSHVDISFTADGTVTDLWSYHELEAPMPVIEVGREEAIEIAESIAGANPGIFRACRYGGVTLHLGLIDQVFRTTWRVAFPAAIRRANQSFSDVGWGGTIEIDAETGELVQLQRYK